MNNIIKFTKQEYCDCLNNLLTIDVFIDLNSSFQEGINFTCKQMGTTREDLFSGRYEPN